MFALSTAFELCELEGAAAAEEDPVGGDGFLASSVVVLGSVVVNRSGSSALVLFGCEAGVDEPALFAGCEFGVADVC